MIVHPELQALRGDDSPQRRAQQRLIEAIDAWRGQAPMAGIAEQLAAFARGCPIEHVPALAALFEQRSNAACALASGFVRQCAAWISDQPLGHVPLRHFTDGVVSTLLLARSGDVTLSLVALDGQGLARRPAPVTADFGPSEVWERVLAGNARADMVEVGGVTDDGVELCCRDVRLRPGDVVCRSARRQALLVREVEGCLVTLRLQRRDPRGGPTREYRLADGSLVHQAAGHPQASRIELLLTLLGRMRRTDAAPLLAEIACEPGSEALRWQALRECLALDTLAGMIALGAIADAPDDRLAGAARALRLQLVEAHPQLADVAGAVPCLA